MKQTILLVLVLGCLAGCSKGRERAPVVVEPEGAVSPPVEYGRSALALLQSGEYPLWFELGGEGPALIASAEEAPLHPFVPWPLTRRVAGIVGGDDRIILGINREGFLVFVPWEGEERGIALYRIDNGAYWKDYSVESLFVFGSTPAALLYRDDYFIDSALPPPSPRVWGLDGGAGMRELLVGAFEELRPEEGWDIEDLREGADGRWRYRAIRKGGGLRGMGYFSAGDLALPGEPSSQGELQNASRPRGLEEAPEPLRRVLEAGLGSEGGRAGIAAVVSPGFASLRHYGGEAAQGSGAGGGDFYPGYYVSGGLGDIALVVDPRGRGFIGAGRVDGVDGVDGVGRAGRVGRGDGVALREFALPALPKGFVYTGVAFFARPSPAGGVFVTALGIWEEQENWNVGAAGFVLAPDYAILEL